MTKKKEVEIVLSTIITVVLLSIIAFLLAVMAIGSQIIIKC